jgi:O-antigen ligase
MKIIRVGICLLAAFSVLAHGAVEVWSVSVLEIGAAALLLLWGVLTFRTPEAELHENALLWPLAAFLLLGLAQLVFGWSLYPFLTRTELPRIGSCFVLFFLAAQAFRERRHLRALVWFLLFLGFAVALFGVVQFFTSNGKLYWVREVQEGSYFFGPYVNRNHFAGFVELISPLGLAVLLFRGVRRDLLPLAGLFTLVLVGALFVSPSRGGIVGFGFEVLVLAFLAFRQERKIPRRAAVVFLLALVALVAWLDAGQAVERFAKSRPGDVASSRRMVMLKGTLHIFLDHPLTGTGLGTFVTVYPRYETLYDGKIVNHAHNDYAEALADTGLPGGLCGLAFLLLLFRGAFSRLDAEQSRFSLALHAGSLAACCGLLLHSLVDFNLHLPSNALLFLLQAFLATSPVLAEEPVRRRVSRRTSSVVDIGMPSSP